MPEDVMNADAGTLQWASAFWVTLALLAGLWIGRTVARRYIRPEADGWFATAFHSTRFALLAVVLLLFGMSLISRDWDLWLRPLIIGLAVLQAGLWGNALIAHWLADYQRRHLTENAEAVTSVRAAGFVARLLLFTLLVLLVLDNIPGVDVTALIAGLGIGGIAVALAVQNILADLFASFSISLDKPFAIGDFITVGEYMGTVENIGLKTTRLRSLSGEQLVIANDDLLRSRIRNYRRMSERRIVFGFGIVYQTAHRKLQAVTGIVREIIEGTDQTRFDRAHFKAYGDSALEFEVVYYVLAPDYSRYMDIQESINLALFRRFEEEGIEFAYPTRTLYLRSQGGD